MRRSIYVFLAAAILGLPLSGCAKDEAPPAAQTAAPASASPSAAKKVVDPAATGTIRGTVSYDGAVPAAKMLSVKGNPECAVLHQGGEIASEELVVDGGKLRNVVVHPRQGLEGYVFETPAASVEIDNKNCVYVPHVSSAMVGQEIIFLNGDSTLHNVHSYPKNSKSFNLGLPLVGMKQSKRITTAEVAIPLKCDVHPWMQGYLAVLPHPVHAVTGADGSFELKGVPAGDYVIEAWHEKLGAQTQNVTVTAGQTSEIAFTYAAL